jgi:hypothetical protein
MPFEKASPLGHWDIEKLRKRNAVVEEEQTVVISVVAVISDAVTGVE